MRLIFKYHNNGNSVFPICIPENSALDEEFADYVSIYISSLYMTHNVYSELYDLSIKSEYICTDVIDAIIDDERVLIGSNLYLKGDEPEDYDPNETWFYSIDRRELIYLVERWYQFIGFRSRMITNPTYQEIINTEEAYK